MKLFIALAMCAFLAAEVASHGHLKEPIARTSIFLRPEFNTEQPYWWDHQGVWCNNVQQDMSYSSCGRCGDALGASDANQGGIYDKGVIVANYTRGSIIEVTANFQAAHYGSFHVELCPQLTETDDCFQLLPIVGGTEEVRGDSICVPHDNAISVDVTARVQLPADATCTRCTLRWTYRTSYPGPADWDICENPRPTQTFRNCADIGIY